MKLAPPYPKLIKEFITTKRDLILTQRKKVHSYFNIPVVYLKLDGAIHVKLHKTCKGKFHEAAWQVEGKDFGLNRKKSKL
jgi:hypothetical protein